MKWDHICFLIARLDKQINRPAPAKWVALFLLKEEKYTSKLQKRANVLVVRTQMDETRWYYVQRKNVHVGG